MYKNITWTSIHFHYSANISFLSLMEPKKTTPARRKVNRANGAPPGGHIIRGRLGIILGILSGAYWVPYSKNTKQLAAGDNG